MPTPWTDDRVATLQKLWTEGLSAGEIAERLRGVTRNAVLGKLHRLGRLGTGRPTRPPKPAKPRSPRARGRGSPPVRPVGAAPKRPMPSLPDPMGPFLPLLALRPGHCRWPIGDPLAPGFGFCGGRTVGGPYCAGHAAVAFDRRGGARRGSRAA